MATARYLVLREQGVSGPDTDSPIHHIDDRHVRTFSEAFDIAEEQVEVLGIGRKSRRIVATRRGHEVLSHE